MNMVKSYNTKQCILWLKLADCVASRQAMVLLGRRMHAAHFAQDPTLNMSMGARLFDVHSTHTSHQHKLVDTVEAPYIHSRKCKHQGRCSA